MIRDEAERAARRVIAQANKARRAARPKPPKTAPKIAHVNVKADRGRVRDKGFLRWLHSQPCAVREQSGFSCSGPIQACHIRTHKPGELPTGLQRKPDDRRCTSMCAKHHAEQHGMNEARFWAIRGLDPFEVAERLYVEYQRRAPVDQP